MLNYENTWQEFSEIYEKAAVCTAKACVKAWELDKLDKERFRLDIMNMYGVAKGTASKMITAGEIIATASYELPPSYSNVYELAPVREDLDNFALFVSQHEDTYHKPIKSMTQKEIRSAVNSFLNVQEVDKVVDKPKEQEIIIDPVLDKLADDIYQLKILLEDMYDCKDTITKKVIREVSNIYDKCVKLSEGR